MTTTSIQPESKITAGQTFTQIRPGAGPDGQPLVRVIEIIAAPTLSAPAGYKVVRNDAHPHRAGKTGTIRVVDLLRKYQAVSA